MSEREIMGSRFLTPEELYRRRLDDLAAIIDAPDDEYDGSRIVDALDEVMVSINDVPGNTPADNIRVISELADRGIARATDIARPGDVTPKRLRQNTDVFGIESGGYSLTGETVLYEGQPGIQVQLYRRPDGTLAEGHRIVATPGRNGGPPRYGFVPMEGSSVAFAAGRRAAELAKIVSA